jgi:hypothetical protein
VVSDIVYLDEAHQIAKVKKTAVCGYYHYRALSIFTNPFYYSGQWLWYAGLASHLLPVL